MLPSLATMSTIGTVAGLLLTALVFRARAARVAASASAPADLGSVTEAELDYLTRHRHPHRTKDNVRYGLIGLALSGGGIRSATASLGVLQAMSRMGLLEKVDYVSSVSGGGYIAGCLSAYLSWNERGTPDDPLDPRRFAFALGERPAFSTDWATMPFRAEPLQGGRRIGEDILAHLRTHGNFLISRIGVFRRETMRSLGVVLTGVSYNLFFFLLTIATASAIYLATAMALSHELHDRFMARGVVTTGVRARPTLLEGEPVIAKECVGTDCADHSRTVRHAPTYWEEAAFGVSLVSERLKDPARCTRLYCDTIVKSVLLAALLNGALYSAIVMLLVWVVLKGYLANAGAFALPPGKRGLSQEDSFEQYVVTALTVATVLFVVGVTWHARAHSDGVSGGDDLVWLYVPFATAAGVRLAGIVLAILMPALMGTRWTRRLRSLWGEFQAITIYSWWATLGFALLPIPVYALVAVKERVAGGGLVSLAATYLLSTRRAGPLSRFPRIASLRRPLLTLAVFALVMCVVVLCCAVLANLVNRYQFWTVLALGGTLALLSVLVDVNKLSLHFFYRDRLAETYLMSEVQSRKEGLALYFDAIEMPLRELHGDGPAPWQNRAPYHLINAAINLAGSRDLTRKDRRSGYWLFSKLFCGSTHTGFRHTDEYRGGGTGLSRALAISGAAVSSAVGFETFFAQAFATTLFNVRLGVWMENPAKSGSLTSQEGGVFWPWYLWREAAMQTNELTRLVNLSDGAQTGDGLGIYALFQRRCKVIVAMDACEDAALSFDAFTEALRQAYVDMGVDVDIDLTMIRPHPGKGLSRSHCAVGRIRYPDRPEQESYLVYMKNSITGDEQEPVLNYRACSPAFPHETTIDQFFTDAQFESYRALGYHVAEAAFGSWLRDPRVRAAL
jgi:hypothetical protein